ncbi:MULTISPECIES: Gfo/Idh/MocA family oxidoreductase [unclassified Lysobacter]|uniref:Gfo/Idh/MocA family protein n=1 Tax=unclassified Lysobacter TaxID=2635362 RepID=UPI001BEA366A|nr:MULTISPECIES: Gfo/Idh/MocA family oxidoreductase [unclassified Lysobacter]MBT2745959.1 Gfo/Idh/MocA family oxidoreductase [Lysobacter sp. ISL-42]MBT2752658.1 Gfo/Idh/MocA family oxidoreductase [Lysobacter sp. ISL-50]MBT2777397.1 Gfo/Idh/MocA family oxidoreductase [Lysobacter sp. ISL-54]MBT2783588.1 Gfo/Idh/MocA family oxidoreductase [Lysobacter sp. ISL-52]
MNRRDFLATSATASTLLASSAFTQAFARKRGSKLRLGLIGVGMRGQMHLTELLRRDDVEVTALCDVEPIMLDRSLALIAKAGKSKPAVYGADRDNEAYRKMLAKGGLDAVIIATPWEFHAEQAIAAMQARIAVGCEVVAGLSLEDHWQVLRAQQSTGTPYMLLENVCYRRDVLAALNMVRQGLFGEIVHLQGGYQHDLRGVKFNSGNPDQPYGSGVEFGPKAWSEARWRTEHSIKRDADLYPSHGIGPCAMAIDIHRGNRFTHLSAFASKPRGLHDYIVKKAGPDHPNAKVKFKLGDLVTTQILCENGETIVLQHDTSLPRPYSLGFRVQGTNGLWMDVNESIHIEGKSQPHKWDKADDWFAKYDHPLWKRFAAAAADAGHGGMDFFVINAFVEALKADAPMPIDIFDAIAWSAITPLSEQSIAEHKTLEFPDFTGGKWKDRKPIFALNDRY